MERKLRYIEGELMKDNFIIFEPDEIPEAPPPKEMLELETNLDKLENELREVNFSVEQMKNSFMELTELKMVLRRAQLFFEEGSYEVNVNLAGGDEVLVEVPEHREQREALSGYIEMVPQPGDFDVGFRQGHATSTTYTSHHVDFVAGVILRERIAPFERMLWRACRGNIFLRHTDLESIEDPATGEPLDKCMFMVFFQGEQLRSRVEKICDGFHATLYTCPDTQEKRQAMLLDVTTRREDLQVVLHRTSEHRMRVLETAAHSLREWFYKVHKMKSVYHALNLFNLDVTTKCMIGECWSAVSDLDTVHMALRRGMERSNSSLQPILNRLHTTEQPPTFHRVNKFTSAFQNIVDAYGVARYREVNPALFSVITFPFLFAVMFGDAGHGLIMFLAGLFLVLWEKRLIASKVKGEMWDTFFGGRYIILLMGAFSIYTGMVYNDIFSKATNIFGSSWYPLYDERTLDRGEPLQLNPAVHSATNVTGMFAGFPYPFGLDPVWQLSQNAIMLTNSFKMKMSIIIGVLHMLFGIILGAFNYKFFRNSLAIYCELIPEVIFLLSIFGYLVAIIFYKWIAYDANDAPTAPSLLLVLINMMKFSYDNKDGVQPLYSGQLVLLPCRQESNSPSGCAPGELGSFKDLLNSAHAHWMLTHFPCISFTDCVDFKIVVQSILVVLAVLCVPWLLFAKPLLLRRQNRIRTTINAIRAAGENGLSGPQAGGSGDYVPFRNESSSNHTANSSHHVDGDGGGGGGHGDSGKFDFGEVLTYQAIHTIEFCLGCISNTASYLRLWALSLAHAQLSEVLWEMVMVKGLKVDGYYGCIILFFVFAAWAVLTVGVLVLMEGLSAFLHALRLHWVEFQNKFYEGSGYLFEPFSFVHIDKLSAE
ncbi:unnamed protein product [Mesocestoides corti]|uniref:V-type proton ATPase subunit a n=1 Tax=Mesocestoides corti TaxID=53468 RepID=A0A0R3UHC9_MESCO|nr:unnamed protein product [Mesocestoides corti]